MASYTRERDQFIATATRAGLFVACLLPSLAQAEPLQIPGSVFIVAQSLDLHSTAYALARGHTEGNPVMQGSTAKRIALKGAGTAGVVYLAHELNRRGRRKTARVLLYSVSAFTVGVAARNYQIGGTP